MENTELNKREQLIYEQYQNVIAPFIMELEVRDTEYPIEIFNEIRAIFTHLSRYKLQNSSSDLNAAEKHVKRAVLDCFKYLCVLCVSISEKVNKFRTEYKNVDLNLADNGKFLPHLGELENEAKKLNVKAKQSEIKKLNDDELYALYEAAYIKYSELDKFLDDSNEAILFATTHTKRKEIISKISIGVTVLSIIVAVYALI